MPKVKFVDFKAVKAAITMEQVIQHYGLTETFKRGTDSLNGPCPIHKGSNPTQFRASLSKNIWNCFSKCACGGNVLDFIAKMENVSIHAAALKAMEWFNLDPEAMSGDSDRDDAAEAEEAKPAPKAAVKKSAAPAEPSVPNVPLKFRLDKLERNHPYLTRERGLTHETIIDFGIGFCSKGMMADRIAIPIHNVKGEVVAYAGRFPVEEPPEGTPKYKLPQGFRKSQELFNADRAFKEPGPLVIVEGFFDAMKLHQHDCKKVVALMGATMSAAQEELIRQHTDSRSQVIVMLDENEAGRAGREDIACRLSRFCFVRAHELPQPDMEPEHLTAEEVQQFMGGIPVKRYIGRRQGFAVIVTVDGQRLDPRFDLWNHSPTGFEWGYCGSGPAQLALAILADHCSDDERALNFYQRYKWVVVAGLPYRGWTLTSEEIELVLQQLHEGEAVGGGRT